MEYQTNPDTFLHTPLGEESVLLDLQTNEYYSFNETYTQIFRLLQQLKSVNEITARLAEIYEIEHEVCRQEVERVAAELSDKGFIRPASTLS